MEIGQIPDLEYARWWIRRPPNLLGTRSQAGFFQRSKGPGAFLVRNGGFTIGPPKVCAGAELRLGVAAPFIKGSPVFGPPGGEEQKGGGNQGRAKGGPKGIRKKGALGNKGGQQGINTAEK